MVHSINARIGSDKFPVIIGNHLINDLDSYLKFYKKENVLIICDNFFLNSTDKVSKDLRTFLNKYNHHFIDGGIEEKSVGSFLEVIKLLSKLNISRDGLILGIGGGVVGDLTAFVASTYKRGINLVHVPTTTTAMIDSCLGGKTGLNYLDQVNLIGTYHNPKAIFIDIQFLYSLKERDYYSGLCEAIKMALTSDNKMVHRLLSLSSYVESKDNKALEEIIYWSILTKLRHVADDAHEKAVRLILNYGHTFGQSIESFYGINQDELRHGEAVALGIKVASKLSFLINTDAHTKDSYKITNKLLQKYKLPVKFSDLAINRIPKLDYLVDNLINDKKRLSDGNRFILCYKTGFAEIKIINNLEKIYEAYKDIF